MLQHADVDCRHEDSHEAAGALTAVYVVLVLDVVGLLQDRGHAADPSDCATGERSKKALHQHS